MDTKHYEEVKKKFGKWGTWALWRPGNPYDPSYISAHIEKLKPYYVFVDLSASKEMADKEAGLRAIFSGSREFEGSYMTDLVKDLPYLKAADVYAKVKNDERLRTHNALALKEELEALGPVKMAYLFGHRVWRLWKKCPALSGIPCTRITHFAAEGTDVIDKIRNELGIT